MKEIKQFVAKRKSYKRDEGTMGFHDYVTVKEDFTEFVERVTKACETVNGKILNISYPNEDIAVIVIRYKDGE